MDRLSIFVFLLSLWASSVLAEELGSDQTSVREPRGIRRRCRKYGICPGGYGGHGQQGFGGHGQQGFGGGYPGFGGHQGGFGQGYPPINIGISQSQSSANAGGGGHGHGNYPNNYQYNGGYGFHGYPGHYNGYQGQGYHGQPGYFGNQGPYNNQFNGNYYGPNGGPGFQGYPGGFGYQGPFGNGYYDEGEKPVHEHSDHHENEISHQNVGNENYSEAGSHAYAGRKN